MIINWRAKKRGTISKKINIIMYSLLVGDYEILLYTRNIIMYSLLVSKCVLV